MKKYLIIFFLLLVPLAFAVSNPVTHNGKTYYIVTSTDPTEDTGNEVCTKVGMVCNGFTEPTTAVCKLFHPNAAESSSLSGDQSGVYCNGAPQNGVCASKTDTCHACPQCTVSVQCNQPIGGLYREMYVECAPATATNTCKVRVSSLNVPQFFAEIPSLNAQLQGCPTPLPTGSGLVLSNGNNVVNVNMNNGQTQSFTLIVANKQITGIAAGASTPCKQTFTISENDMNTVLGSSNRLQSVALLVAQKKIGIKGCSFLTGFKLFFARPIVRFAARRQAPPQPPPPKPAPNCGNVGEQCNNRGCFSGICAAPKENINGQWGFWNYRCIDQSDWNAYCQGQGNTPAPWSCLTGPCR